MSESTVMTVAAIFKCYPYKMDTAKKEITNDHNLVKWTDVGTDRLTIGHFFVLEYGYNYCFRFVLNK